MLPWTLKRAKIGKECIIFSSDNILLIVTRLCGSFRMSTRVRHFHLGRTNRNKLNKKMAFD